MKLKCVSMPTGEGYFPILWLRVSRFLLGDSGEGPVGDPLLHWWRVRAVWCSVLLQELWSLQWVSTAHMWSSPTFTFSAHFETCRKWNWKVVKKLLYRLSIDYVNMFHRLLPTSNYLRINLLHENARTWLHTICFCKYQVKNYNYMWSL